MEIVRGKNYINAIDGKQEECGNCPALRKAAHAIMEDLLRRDESDPRLPVFAWCDPAIIRKFAGLKNVKARDMGFILSTEKNLRMTADSGTADGGRTTISGKCHLEETQDKIIADAKQLRQDEKDAKKEKRRKRRRH